MGRGGNVHREDVLCQVSVLREGGLRVRDESKPNGGVHGGWREGEESCLNGVIVMWHTLGRSACAREVCE